MKKFTLLVLSIFCFGLSTNQVIAQEGYTYTLVDNGSYSYTISAVPNASPSNFETSVQSYGFTIIVPDGVTTTIMSSLGSSVGATPFDGSAVGMPTIDGYLISETLAAPINLIELPSTGTPTPMVTIQVNGSPTTGDISLLANNSSLATTITALKCFMSADMVDDAMAVFPPVVDAVGSGLSGTTVYNFSTLSVPENQLSEETFKMYPNPATEYVFISASFKIDKIEIYNILGKKELSENKSSKINIKELASGVYFLHVYSNKSVIPKKLVVE